MNKKTLLMAACALVMAVGGCGGSADGPSGRFEGTMMLSRTYYGSDLKDPLGGGSGDVEFPYHDSFRFGSTTPLPDCRVSISKLSDDEFLITGMTQMRGESNDGQGCRIRLLADLEVPAIVEGRIYLNADGELRVKAFIQRRDSPDSDRYELEFRGKRKGWF